MKTTSIIWTIVALLVLGGLIFYFVSNNTNQISYNATSTPTTSTNTTNQTTTSQSYIGLPIAVTNGNAVPSDTTVVVTGQVTPNGVFTNYWYEYGTTANLGSKTPNQMIGSGFASIPAPIYITGLLKSMVYYFRLVAENQYGRATGKQYAFQTTAGNPPPIGSAPKTTTSVANGISRTTVNLNGQVNPNKAVTQYWFEYGKTANLGDTTSLVSVGNGAVSLLASVSLSNLEPSTTYYFRLDAQNQFGTVNGTILNFKTLGPPASIEPVVTTQVASPTATTTSTLRGTVNPKGFQTTYWFEYSTDPLFKTASLKTTPQKSAGAVSTTVSVEVNVSSLKSGTTYYYRIVAQNSAGTVRGDSLSFTTK